MRVGCRVVTHTVALQLALQLYRFDCEPSPLLHDE